MSTEDDARSPLAEADAASSKPGPKAAKPTDSKGGRAAKPGERRPQPNKPDPEEVQYPGYFNGQGSL